MCPWKRIAIVVFMSGLAMSARPVFAAEPITVATSSDETLSLSTKEAPFDWSGFYVGIYAGIRTDAVGDAYVPVGISIGGSTHTGLFVLGADLSISGVPDAGVADTAHGQILGRAGLLVTDDVMVYAAGGYGMDLTSSGGSGALAGGGLELVVTESLSVRAQYLHEFSSDPTAQTNQFSLGANFHF